MRSERNLKLLYMSVDIADIGVVVNILQLTAIYIRIHKYIFLILCRVLFNTIFENLTKKKKQIFN